MIDAEQSWLQPAIDNEVYSLQVGSDLRSLSGLIVCLIKIAYGLQTLSKERSALFVDIGCTESIKAHKQERQKIEMAASTDTQTS